MTQLSAQFIPPVNGHVQVSVAGGATPVLFAIVNIKKGVFAMLLEASVFVALTK